MTICSINNNYPEDQVYERVDFETFSRESFEEAKKKFNTELHFFGPIKDQNTAIKCSDYLNGRYGLTKPFKFIPTFCPDCNKTSIAYNINESEVKKTIENSRKMVPDEQLESEVLKNLHNILYGFWIETFTIIKLDKYNENLSVIPAITYSDNVIQFPSKQNEPI